MIESDNDCQGYHANEFLNRNTLDKQRKKQPSTDCFASDAILEISRIISKYGYYLMYIDKIIFDCFIIMAEQERFELSLRLPVLSP